MNCYLPRPIEVMDGKWNCGCIAGVFNDRVEEAAREGRAVLEWKCGVGV